MMEKVIYMGTPDFAVGPLEALIGAGYHVQAVFTQPDRPKGRHGEPAAPPVKETALRYGIPVWQPAHIRDPENLKILQDYAPDVIVVAAFGQIIPQSVLDLPPFGCINIHASLLPSYRGAAPIQWAVIDGEKESGVTTMRMNAGLDTGDIIMKTVVPLDPEETGGSLFEKLSAAGSALILETLTAVENGSAVYTPQPEKSPTHYASMLKREDGVINWNESARAIERRVRGLDPWPGAYTFLDQKQLKVWRCALEDSECRNTADAPERMDPPGTILPGNAAEIRVQTGSGVLKLLEVQSAGKKRMDAAAFLRGKAVEPGTILG